MIFIFENLIAILFTRFYEHHLNIFNLVFEAFNCAIFLEKLVTMNCDRIVALIYLLFSACGAVSGNGATL